MNNLCTEPGRGPGFIFGSHGGTGKSTLAREFSSASVMDRIRCCCLAPWTDVPGRPMSNVDGVGHNYPYLPSGIDGPESLAEALLQSPSVTAVTVGEEAMAELRLAQGLFALRNGYLTAAELLTRDVELNGFWMRIDADEGVMWLLGEVDDSRIRVVDVRCELEVMARITFDEMPWLEIEGRSTPAKAYAYPKMEQRDDRSSRNMFVSDMRRMDANFAVTVALATGNLVSSANRFGEMIKQLAMNIEEVIIEGAHAELDDDGFVQFAADIRAIVEDPAFADLKEEAVSYIDLLADLSLGPVDFGASRRLRSCCRTILAGEWNSRADFADSFENLRATMRASEQDVAAFLMVLAKKKGRTDGSHEPVDDNGYFQIDGDIRWDPSDRPSLDAAADLFGQALGGCAWSRRTAVADVLTSKLWSVAPIAALLLFGWVVLGSKRRRHGTRQDLTSVIKASATGIVTSADRCVVQREDGLYTYSGPAPDMTTRLGGLYWIDSATPLSLVFQGQAFPGGVMSDFVAWRSRSLYGLGIMLYAPSHLANPLKARIEDANRHAWFDESLVNGDVFVSFECEEDDKDRCDMIEVTARDVDAYTKVRGDSDIPVYVTMTAPGFDVEANIWPANGLPVRKPKGIWVSARQSGRNKLHLIALRHRDSLWLLDHRALNRAVCLDLSRKSAVKPNSLSLQTASGRALPRRSTTGGTW